MGRSEEFQFGAAHMQRLAQYTNFHNNAALVNIEALNGVQSGEITPSDQESIAHQVSGLQKEARQKLNVPAGKPQTFVGNSSLRNVPGKHSRPSAPRQRSKYN